MQAVALSIFFQVLIFQRKCVKPAFGILQTVDNEKN